MKIKKSLRLKPKKMQKQELYIVKIGGNVIDHPEKLEAFLKDFSEIQNLKFWFTVVENWQPNWPKNSKFHRSFLKEEELPIRRPEMLR